MGRLPFPVYLTNVIISTYNLAYICLDYVWGHNREKYFIALFHVSGHLEQFGGVFLWKNVLFWVDNCLGCLGLAGPYTIWQKVFDLNLG